jgi:metal-responsive CopG/Arc/MetJ family transcriptional regulator
MKKHEPLDTKGTVISIRLDDKTIKEIDELISETKINGLSFNRSQIAREAIIIGLKGLAETVRS